MPIGKWPSIGPYIFVPCICECECGATWLGEPDERVGLYWWSLFKLPSYASATAPGRSQNIFPSTITLSPEAWDKFIEAISNPPEPTEKLINLMRASATTPKRPHQR